MTSPHVIALTGGTHFALINKLGRAHFNCRSLLNNKVWNLGRTTVPKANKMMFSKWTNCYINIVQYNNTFCTSSCTKDEQCDWSKPTKSFTKWVFGYINPLLHLFGCHVSCNSLFLSLLGLRAYIHCNPKVYFLNQAASHLCTQETPTNSSTTNWSQWWMSITQSLSHPYVANMKQQTQHLA